MKPIADEYSDLEEDISIGAAADGTPRIEEFFKLFAQLAAENGDCPDLEYSPVLSGSGYRVDGYALDIPEGADGPSGDLYMAICIYRQEDALPILNSKDIERSVSEVEKFLRLAISDKNLDGLEETSPEFRLAMLIRSYVKVLARVRVIVLTNGHLKTRRKTFEIRKAGNLSLHTNVFDIERYSKISSTGADPVEIDLDENFEGSIPCLKASGISNGYQSYLFAIHGPLLAAIFAEYGNRLLEQNVRTYLQAKTSVNRGILKTISDEPQMFFAYNNGLTATASSVRTEGDESGTLRITYIKDFQIVNGGQTTASILYARDGLKLDLSKVYAQVKLSVIDESQLDQVVPKISEYANTQNKVSLADLASNSPIQIKIERLSKEVTVPPKAGSLHSSKWFYERARGQYKNLFAYKTSAQRKRLETEYPKGQLIEKTDLAKFELAFDGRPHHVSEGAQKCFHRFTTTTLKESEGNDINETWFKFAVAKAILFRSLDHEISRSGWYRSDKGLKAQTVAYAIAGCAQSFRDSGLQIDLMRIWRDQDVPRELMNWMLEMARTVHGILNSPPGAVKNPSEFCKKEFCWTLHVKGKLGELPRGVKDYGVAIKEFSVEIAGGRREDQRHSDLDFEIALANLIPKASEIRMMAQNKYLVSSNNERALSKLESGRFNFSKAELNALKTLLSRLEIKY